MSERYSRLFSLQPNLYIKESPVVISAGALLKDNSNGNILVQLKIKNISDKIVKVAKVRIQEMDSINKPIGEPIEYEYLDLNVFRDQEFGQKVAISVSDSSTRAFSVSVFEVDFVDNSSWINDNCAWESLPEQEVFDDYELLKQYQIHYGASANYKAIEHKDLWFCACGAINHQEESKCHYCDNELSELSSCDWEALTEEKEKRLAEEQAKKEADVEAARIKKEENKEKAKKWTIRGLIIAVIVIIAIIATVFIVRAVKNSNSYREAEELFEAGDYINAEEIFKELGNYKDSDEKVTECIYQQSMVLLEQKKDNEAYDLLASIPDYKDVTNYLNNFKMVPAQVVINASYSQQYDFSYDDSGKMISATQKWLDKGNSQYKFVFDENGQVTQKINITNGEKVICNYNYNPDGTVTETSGNSVTNYDQFGNRISVAYSNGHNYDYNGKDQYDEHHNITSNEHFNKKSDVKNTYDSSGEYLVSVSYQLNNLRRLSEFAYIPKYMPNQEVNYDLIWKNIRIMAGGDIWWY